MGNLPTLRIHELILFTIAVFFLREKVMGNHFDLDWNPST
jgi:hypothetical protein